MKYWLLKTEPSTYSWNDLQQEATQTVKWEGVRNYQARNFIRTMKKGDLAFFYHSMAKPNIITGIVEVVREAYSDITASDPTHKYYDPKNNPGNPRWSAFDVQIKQNFKNSITRDLLKEIPQLTQMELLKKGSRLSIQPVTFQEWMVITKLPDLMK